MNYSTLTLSGLARNRTRFMLTLLSIAVAFLLFGLLRPVANLFQNGPRLPESNRLIVSPKHSVSDMLTLAHAGRIQNMPGIELVAHQTWFGGIYIDPANSFPQWVVPPAAFLELSKALILPAPHQAAFVTKRTGAIAGRALADKYNWKIGEKIPLIPSIWHNLDGTHWDFELVGIFDGRTKKVDTNSLYLNFEYFDEYRAFAKGTIGNVLLRVSDAKDLESVAAQVDTLFANSQDETTTVTESEYLLSFVRQLGDIALIVDSILFAVFFTIILLTINTMSQSTRERIPDYAVLRALGFRNRHVFVLILIESIVITCIGALLGMGIAVSIIDNLGTLAPSLDQFSLVSVQLEDYLLAGLIAIFLGFLVGLQPANKAIKMSIIDALKPV